MNVVVFTEHAQFFLWAQFQENIFFMLYWAQNIAFEQPEHSQVLKCYDIIHWSAFTLTKGQGYWLVGLWKIPLALGHLDWQAVLTFMLIAFTSNCSTLIKYWFPNC